MTASPHARGASAPVHDLYRSSVGTDATFVPVKVLPPTFTSLGDAAAGVAAKLTTSRHGSVVATPGDNADPPGPDPRALDAYHEFLLMELRYLGAERGIRRGAPCNTAANAFHDDARLPGHTPSTRAERVLATLGIDWTKDEREVCEVWPLPTASSVEAA